MRRTHLLSPDLIGRKTTVAVLVPCAVMLALGLWGLRRGTMWRDEAATFQVARRSLAEIWHLLGGIDAVHGLYYLLMHAVLTVRADEIALRLPSVLASVATAGTLALLGCRLASPRVGLWAGLLFAVSPLVGHYAQEGRSYALVAAGAALSTLLLARAVEGEATGAGAGRWAAYAAVTALTALLHEFALLLLLAHALTLLLSRVPLRVLRHWALAVCAVAAALLPLVALSRGQSDQVGWLSTPGEREARELVYAFIGPAGLVAAVTLLLMAVALLRPLPRRPHALGLTAVAAPLALLPPTLLFLLSQVRPLFSDRYVLFAVTGVAPLAAAGAERLVRMLPTAPARGVLAAAGAACVAAAFLWQLPYHHRERLPTSRPDDLAAVCALVAHKARPGDAVFFVPAYERRLMLTYPASFQGLRDLRLGTSGPASGTLYGREAPLKELRARLLRTERVWVVAHARIERTEWFAANDGESARWELLHELFREQYAEWARGGEVALYVRR